jgi:hypothetical protein
MRLVTALPLQIRQWITDVLLQLLLPLAVARKFGAAVLCGTMLPG